MPRVKVSRKIRKTKNGGSTTITKSNASLTNKQKYALKNKELAEKNAKTKMIGKTIRAVSRNITEGFAARQATKSQAKQYSSLINSGVTTQSPSDDSNSNNSSNPKGFDPNSLADQL